MADVNGDLINTDTSGDPAPTTTFATLSEPGEAVEVSNSTSAGGATVTVERTLPKLTRELP